MSQSKPVTKRVLILDGLDRPVFEAHWLNYQMDLLLKNSEKAPYEMYDMIIGIGAGALLAVMYGVYNMNCDATRDKLDTFDKDVIYAR